MESCRSRFSNYFLEPRKWGSVADFWHAWCYPSRTLCSKALFAGALAIWMRWDATLFAETDDLADWGRCSAAPRWRRRAQLFRLEWVKFILAVDCSHLACLTASNCNLWLPCYLVYLFLIFNRGMCHYFILCACVLYTDCQCSVCWTGRNRFQRISTNCWRSGTTKEAVLF